MNIETLESAKAIVNTPVNYGDKKWEAYVGCDLNTISENILPIKIAGLIELELGVSFDEMKTRLRHNGGSGNKPIVLARQLFGFFMYEYSETSLAKIGELINRDHSTVLHGKGVIYDRIEFDKEIRVLVYRIRKSLEIMGAKKFTRILDKKPTTARRNKMTSVKVREMRLKYSLGSTVPELAGEYNFCYETIWRVVHHKTWKGVK